jgi:hypothetical protein
MRIVGQVNRAPFEPDPGLAWHRGRLLDARLRSPGAGSPRGVIRATHAQMARLDEARMIAAARLVNRR